MKWTNFLIVIGAFFSISHQLLAQSFEFEKNAVAENRIEINLSDFKLKFNHPDIEAHFIENSVKWVRNDANLLTPIALIRLIFLPNLRTETLFIRNKNHKYFATTTSGHSILDISIDLFNPSVIEIYEGAKLIETVSIETKSLLTSQNKIREEKNLAKQLIDYSCSPYNLEISGLDDDYLSVGCILDKTGSIGNETPRLEVTFSSTNLIALNGQEPPFKINLIDSQPIYIELRNRSGEIKKLSFKAVLSDRVHRLKTAVGFGPYVYSSQESKKYISHDLSWSFMFYGKFDLNKSSSFKFFDALVYPKTLFNNTGLYFSYDLAEVFDGRVVINTLLGFQGLVFQHDNHSELKLDMIFPQGFEITYKHAFDLENYHLVYGMFILNGDKDYSNLWLRFGEKMFYEANYISWKFKDISYKTWGLSVGIPFSQWF